MLSVFRGRLSSALSVRHQFTSTVAPSMTHRSMSTKILYTYTDEAPMLATYSLLPVIRRFTQPAGINVELIDISVAARILSQFPERLTAAQKMPDNLSILGALCKTKDANIIKLPNVSASIPQLQDAIDELQSKGYNIPKYPTNPVTDEEKDIAKRYAKVLGSAVNPVLREGNSDRRVAAPVKNFARKNPKKLMNWSKDAKTHVASMTSDDFYAKEESQTLSSSTFDIIFKKGNDAIVLKKGIVAKDGDVVDATFMSAMKLQEYLEREMQDAQNKNLLLSVHLKATMMKVSDPIIFGHVMRVYFKDLFAKHGGLLQELKYNPNTGLGNLYDAIANHPKKAEIEATIQECYKKRPSIAMVNSAKGITNLHVPSDVIVDASMPVVVRDAGCMWNKDNKLQETKCLIPDRSYAGIYEAVFQDIKLNGQYNPATMGNVANVGLMAQKAEEYGSHDTTFEIKDDGMIVVQGEGNKVLFNQSVRKGDIWRMCRTTDAAIKDWVRLAVSRAQVTNNTTIFWLDDKRAHDRQLTQKVQQYLKAYDTSKLDILIMDPVSAMKKTLERVRLGKDTVSVTGNVLRDYLTDLFPILELGTSAKMLSIVPLLAGGSMFETGAGGSAPKHVQQFVEEGHLRWDSMGEYLALAVSLEDLGEKTNNSRATTLASTLNEAIGKLLDTSKSPSIKVKEIDNRGSTYYIARYWAEFMAKHDSSFKSLSEELIKNEATIMKDLIDCQGKAVDIGGYYRPDDIKTERAMRSSQTLNNIINTAGIAKF